MSHPASLIPFVIVLALPAQTNVDTASTALQKALAGKTGPTARTRFLLSRAEDTPRALTVTVETLLAAEPSLHSRLRRIAVNSSRMRDRRTALAALLRAKDDALVCRRAVRDRADEIRQHLVVRYRQLGRTAAAVTTLTRHLTSRNKTRRIRAAQLLVALDDARAIPALRRALKNRRRRASATRGPKVYIALMRQQSYVRDMDVEVASRSFIADPKLGVVQDGAVLATEVLSSRTTRVYTESIRALITSQRQSRRRQREN